MRRLRVILCAALIAGCAQQTRPSACCAAPGSARAQVESVLGPPAPPASSKWHPFPSPPPNAPIYTTEHGYLTVTYAEPKKLATRFSLDFYEGKSPGDAFRLAGAYLPKDAVDTKGRAIGAQANIRVFKSAQLAKALPSSHGMLYLECTGPQPAILCEKADVAVGSP